MLIFYTMVHKIFQKKSEIAMLLAGVSLLSSVVVVVTTGDFIFWKIAKFFYMGGVLLILFNE